MTDTARLVLPYKPLPWQMEVKRDQHRFKVIVAGRRSGKTVLGADDLTVAASTIPGSMCWYVGPTYTAARDIAWQIFKDNFADFHAYGLVKRIVESDLRIDLANGSTLMLKGGDKPDSLRGVKLSRLVIDEFAVMKAEVWDEVLQPATSDLRAPVIFIGTPKGYNRFYDLAQMETTNPGDWRTWRIKTAEAGTVPAEELERARRDMDERVYAQEFCADFRTFGGQVYTDFDRARHVPADPIPFLPGAEYALGMDFGWSSPSVVLFANIDAQENVTVFAEYERRETPIPVIGLAIKNQVPGALPTLIACDPAGAAKSEAMGLDAVSELRSLFGREVVRYRSNYPGVIQDGINIVRKWLRNGKLKVSRNCPKLIQALEMYRYPDPKDNVQSELPLKDGISDHSVDALRYLMTYRFHRKTTVEAA